MTTTIQELVTTAFSLYHDQKIDEAYAILDEQGDRFPEYEDHIVLWKSSFLAKGGHHDRAIDNLATHIEAGHWYYEFILRGTNEFETLQGDPAFEKLVKSSLQQIQDIKDNSPKKRLEFPPENHEADTASPLLIALHGNNSSAELSVGHWKPASKNGWYVALPQSTQAVASTLARWDDEEWATEDVTHHFNELINTQQIDSEQIVLGGFSMGARMALSLGLNGSIPVKGIIALGAAMGDGLARWLPYLEAAQTHKPRVYLIVGDADDTQTIYEPMRLFVSYLNEYDIPRRIHIYKGLGHDFPGDFEDTLQKALDWITEDD